MIRLEQQLEQAQLQAHMSSQHRDTRDRVRGELADKVEDLLGHSNECIRLRKWSSLVDHQLGDLEAVGVYESADATVLVNRALQDLQDWEQLCVTQLGEVSHKSELACTELATALRDLSSALLCGLLTASDVLIRPKVSNLRAALDIEQVVHDDTKGLLRSWPEQSVVVALHAIQVTVTVALTRSESMMGLQERLGPLLPALRAQRPEISRIQTLDNQLKKLKQKADLLALELRHLMDDGDVEGTTEAEQKLRQARAELTRVVRERQQHISAASALVNQFPELLLPDTQGKPSSLRLALDSNGLDMGVSLSMFSEREILANQDVRHSVYKARLGDNWSCLFCNSLLCCLDFISM